MSSQQDPTLTIRMDESIHLSNKEGAKSSLITTSPFANFEVGLVFKLTEWWNWERDTGVLI